MLVDRVVSEMYEVLVLWEVEQSCGSQTVCYSAMINFGLIREEVYCIESS